jgi:hypothetical protein
MNVILHRSVILEQASREIKVFVFLPIIVTLC